MTIKELEAKAESLKNSKFNKGEQILFCVDYAFFTGYRIHSRLFSTAEKALNFYNSLSEQYFRSAYAVFDIWNNPKQIDR